MTPEEQAEWEAAADALREVLARLPRREHRALLTPFLKAYIQAESGETPPATERLCACGCGWPVTSPRPEAKYATAACRVRAHRAAT